MMRAGAGMERVAPPVGSRSRPLAVVRPPEDALLGDMLGADHSGSARPVVDDHGLPQPPGQLLAKQATNHVGPGPCWKGHDETHRLARPCFGRLCERA